MNNSKKILHDLCRRQNTISELIKHGRKDNMTLAIILTEDYFRRPFRRLQEYIVWSILYSLGLNRANYMSLGIAQVQFRFWLEYSDLPKNRLPSFYLRCFANLSMNYDICYEYLQRRGITSQTPLPKVTEAYVGEMRDYYCRVLAAHYRLASRRL